MLRSAASLFVYQQPLRTSLQLLIVFMPSFNCGHLFCLCHRTSPPGDTHGPHSHFSQIEIFFAAYELSRRMRPLLLSSRPRLCGSKNLQIERTHDSTILQIILCFLYFAWDSYTKKISLCFRRVSRRFACRFSK